MLFEQVFGQGIELRHGKRGGGEKIRHGQGSEIKEEWAIIAIQKK